MNFLEAAYKILSDANTALHYSEIARQALAQNLISTSGLTPESTMGSRLYVDTKRPNSRFVRAGRGQFTLAKRSQPDNIAQRVSAINQHTRRQLRKLLYEMPPDRFEALIGELLIALGFDETTVEVTKYSNDGGIDVRGILNAGGVTEIRAAVQVKRWKKNIQTTTVRNVRGSLTTQEQGIIITTSDFSKGAKEEATAVGKTPISLVNGESLLNLLFHHTIAVSQESYTVYALDDEWWGELLTRKPEAPLQNLISDEKVTNIPIAISYPLTIRAASNHNVTAQLINNSGKVLLDGKTYRSPSGAGKMTSGWKSVNGWTYWQFQHPETSEWHPIDLLRQSVKSRERGVHD